MTVGRGLDPAVIILTKIANHILLRYTVTTIGDYAFNNPYDFGIWHILYKGTSKQWELVSKGSVALPSNATVHCKMNGSEVINTITKEPTCTTKGNLNNKCTFCNEEKNIALDALGHNYVYEGVIAPTCI